MKIDLTPRDIELLLSLIYEVSEIDEDGMASSSSFAADEVGLIEKLESALRYHEILQRGFFDLKVKGLRH